MRGRQTRNSICMLGERSDILIFFGMCLLSEELFNSFELSFILVKIKCMYVNWKRKNKRVH